MKIEIIKPEAELISGLKIRSWPVWESPVTEFDWHYDETEICFFLEGAVEVENGGEKIKISAGDLVIFPKGISCRWKVLEPVKKHYFFGAVPELLK